MAIDPIFTLSSTLDFIHISALQKRVNPRQKCRDARGTSNRETQERKQAASRASKRKELEGSILAREILKLFGSSSR
jgi:hypothetical protein